MISFPSIASAIERLCPARIRLMVLGAVTTLLLAVHFYNCVLAIHQEYLPTSSDEIDYVKSVEYFVSNGQAKAFSTFDELYSLRGEYSFRGPVYAIIFGSPQKIFGFYSIYFIIYSNIFLSIASIFIVFILVKEIELKLISMSIIISSPIFFIYTTSYMMESFQIFVSLIILSVFPILLSYPILGLVVPFLLGFTRQSNFLYSTAAFGRRMSGARFTLMACLWGFALILLSLELHFLHASFPGGKLAEATQMLARLDLLGAGRILASNVTQGAVRYFASPEDGSFYLVARYIFLAATIYCLFLGFGRSQPPLIAAGMAGLAFFIALLALYDVGEWRDLRSLAGITVFSIVILGQHRRRLFLFSALLVQLTVYPALMDYRAQFNGQRVMPFINQMDGAGEQISAYKALSTLPNTRDNQKFILLSVEAGLFPTDMSVAYLSLPVRSDSGVPMRYTFHRNGLPGSSKADYQLSARPCPDSTTALGTSFFQVCRLAVQQSPRGTELDIEN